MRALAKIAARSCAARSHRPPAPRSPTAPPQIKVKTLTGRSINLDFESTQTILDIKVALQEKEGIMANQIRLIFSGKQLCGRARACALAPIDTIARARACADPFARESSLLVAARAPHPCTSTRRLCSRFPSVPRARSQERHRDSRGIKDQRG